MSSYLYYQVWKGNLILTRGVLLSCLTAVVFVGPSRREAWWTPWGHLGLVSAKSSKVKNWENLMIDATTSHLCVFFFLFARISCCIGLYFCWFKLKWLAFFLLLWCLPILAMVLSQPWPWEEWLRKTLPGVKADLWLCKGSVSGLHLYLPTGVFWPLLLCNWWLVVNISKNVFPSPRLRWFACWLQLEVYSEVSLREDSFPVWGCFPHLLF